MRSSCPPLRGQDVSHRRPLSVRPHPARLPCKTHRHRPRISNAIDNVARAAGGLAIATFTAIIVYVVICRYALSFTPRWSEEIPRLLLVWVTSSVRFPPSSATRIFAPA